MIKYEDHCCGCAVPGYPCLGSSCSRMNMPVCYCDYCNDNIHAEYEIEGEHYCEKHAQEYLKEVFEELTVSEQAEILKIPLKVWRR